MNKHSFVFEEHFGANGPVSDIASLIEKLVVSFRDFGNQGRTHH